MYINVPQYVQYTPMYINDKGHVGRVGVQNKGI